MSARALLVAVVLAAASASGVVQAAPKAPPAKAAPKAPAKWTKPTAKPAPTRPVAPKGTAPKPVVKPTPKGPVAPVPATVADAAPPEPATPTPVSTPTPNAASTPTPTPTPTPIANANANATSTPIPTSTPIAVDFTRSLPHGDPPDWFVLALEQEVQAHLARFPALDVKDKLPSERCPTRDPRCLVEQYAAAGVPIVVTGAPGPNHTLTYGVYETWSGARAFQGSLRIAGVSTATLEREIDPIARKVVEQGGVLDQRPIPTPPETRRPRDAHAPIPSRMSGALVPLLVAATLLFFGAPILLVLALVGTRELGRRPTPTSWTWLALLAVVLSALCMTAAFVDLPAAVVHLPPRVATTVSLAWPIVAGALWGALGLTLGIWVLAPLDGFERVRDDAVWPILRAWTLLSLLRAAALVAFYAPVFALTRRACLEADLSDRLTWALAVPTAGLLLLFWLLSVIDNLSVYLDVKLVAGPAKSRNPWQATIKRYFRGYVRRNVVGLDARLLDRTLFLPTARLGVACYGGGFASPRIVVNETTMEAALGELPDDEELADRRANPEELPMGIVFPAIEPVDDATRDRAEALRHALTIAPPRKRAYMARLVGQNATLLGWVLPQPAEDGVPLISDTEEDFGVVKRLLSEHYAAFQLLSHDDEVDDTDPTQKDFLFGPLLRAFGVIARHDVLFATVGLFINVLGSSNGGLSSVARVPMVLFERLLAGPATRVADAYAALNGAAHYLIQYFCLTPSANPDLLTARANLPRLNETSRKLLKELDADKPEGDARDTPSARFRDRAHWLARIFLGPIAPRRFRWMRVVGGVAVTAVAVLLLARSVQEAIAWHPTYVQRTTRTTERESDR